MSLPSFLPVKRHARPRLPSRGVGLGSPHLSVLFKAKTACLSIPAASLVARGSVPCGFPMVCSPAEGAVSDGEPHFNAKALLVSRLAEHVLGFYTYITENGGCLFFQ
jgi:hypothetical protein